MASDLAADGMTRDAVLGGRLRLTQPRRGHRVGHDAILLAAATPAHTGEHAVDFGAGIGAAGLALAARVAGCTVTLVEIDAGLAELAAANARDNGLGDRVRIVTLDITAPARAFTAAGLAAGSVTRVMMNPPFNDPAQQRTSPDPRRQLAHVAARDVLVGWVRSAARLLRPGGTLTLIWRADGLADVLQALNPAFGAVRVLPIHPKVGAPAIRVLVRGTMASRAPLALLPGLFLNDAAGRPTDEAEAVLRGGSALALAEL